VVDGAVEHFKHHIAKAGYPGKFLVIEHRQVFAGDQDDPVIEEENAHGGNAEEEAVLDDIIARPLVDHREMFGLEFQTRQLIGIERGIEGVLIQLHFGGQISFFRLVRTDIDEDLRLFPGASLYFFIRDFIAAQHGRLSALIPEFLTKVKIRILFYYFQHNLAPSWRSPAEKRVANITVIAFI